MRANQDIMDTGLDDTGAAKRNGLSRISLSTDLFDQKQYNCQNGPFNKNIDMNWTK
jgi:hypothetical protein